MGSIPVGGAKSPTFNEVGLFDFLFYNLFFCLLSLPIILLHPLLRLSTTVFHGYTGKIIYVFVQQLRLKQIFIDLKSANPCIIPVNPHFIMTFFVK